MGKRVTPVQKSKHPSRRAADTTGRAQYLNPSGRPLRTLKSPKSKLHPHLKPVSERNQIVQFISQGIALVFGNRRFWPFIWRPMLISAGILLAIIVLGYLLIVPAGDRFLDSRGLDSWLGGTLIRVGYAIVWWFLAGVVFAAISGLFSSLLWDKLSLEIEREVNPNAPLPHLTAGSLMTDTVSRGIFAICIFLCTCGCFWLPPAGIALAAWLCLYDYTASAFLRRGILFPTQFRRALGVRGSATFALVSGLITVVPLLNVLLLPGLVAGGTLMVAEHERRTAQPQ